MAKQWAAMGQALRLSPGVLDAGLSSLAGFAASLYAVRFLSEAELGAFALYLSASLVGGLVPQHLLYLPAQIAVVALPAADRPAMLGSTLRRGFVLAGTVVPLVVVAGLIISAEVAASSLLALGAGAGVLTLLVPAQDHARSTLYLAGRPQHAALVSATQLALTIPALGVLHVLDVSTAWVPFTALGVGSAGGLILGLMLASGASSPEAIAATSTRALFRAGRPLLPAALLQEGTIFAAGALLVGLTSAATLGLAEAARIVSRPVQAFSLGISRSLAPRLMEAGQARSAEGARSAVVLYVGVVGTAGLVYLAVAGWTYPGSPFAELLPTAYEEDGLVALFIAAALLGAIMQVPRGILLGANRGMTILVITAATSAVRLGCIALIAVVTGAYALPMAHIASAIAGGWLSARAAISLLKRPQGMR